MPATDSPLNLEALLDGLAFPAVRVEIVDYADAHGASEEALELLRAIPDRDYRSLTELNAGLGLVGRQPGGENLWPSNPQRQA